MERNGLRVERNGFGDVLFWPEAALPPNALLASVRAAEGRHAKNVRVHLRNDATHAHLYAPLLRHGFVVYAIEREARGHVTVLAKGVCAPLPFIRSSPVLDVRVSSIWWDWVEGAQRVLLYRSGPRRSPRPPMTTPYRKEQVGETAVRALLELSGLRATFRGLSHVRHSRPHGTRPVLHLVALLCAGPFVTRRPTECAPLAADLAGEGLAWYGEEEVRADVPQWAEQILVRPPEILERDARETYDVYWPARRTHYAWCPRPPPGLETFWERSL